MFSHFIYVYFHFHALYWIIRSIFPYLWSNLHFLLPSVSIHIKQPPFSCTATLKCTKLTEREQNSGRADCPSVTHHCSPQDVSTNSPTPSMYARKRFQGPTEETKHYKGLETSAAPVWLMSNTCKKLQPLCYSDVGCWRNLQTTHVTVPGPRLGGCGNRRGRLIPLISAGLRRSLSKRLPVPPNKILKDVD